jgi:hypothetical protein
VTASERAADSTGAPSDGGVLAPSASYLANNIGAVQRFLDENTAVQEKPLQILDLMAVTVFAVPFWLWFGIHRLFTGP